MFVLSDFLTFTNFVYLGWVSFQFNLTSIKRTGSVASGGLLFDRLFFWKNLDSCFLNPAGMMNRLV